MDDIKKIKEEEQAGTGFDGLDRLLSNEGSLDQFVKVSANKVEIQIGVLLILLGIVFFAAMNIENILQYWWAIFFLKPFLWMGFGKKRFYGCWPKR